MTAVTQRPPIPAHELARESQPIPRLRSNHGHYLDQGSIAWMKATTAKTPFEEIRRRYDEDGYVFVKGVIPREDVLSVRQAYFEHLQPTGILKPGSAPQDGIFDDTQDPIAHNGVGPTDLPNNIDRVSKLISAHTMPEYLAFVQHPQLRSFVRGLMGWQNDVLLKRTLLRHNVPNGLSTGLHYDQIFLRGGSAEFLTAWIPIGDCTAEGGGLMYMEDSTSIGKAMEDEFTRRAMKFTEQERIDSRNVHMARDGQLSHDAYDFTEEVMTGKWDNQPSKARRWLVGNYEAGDVVFHNPYMLHVAVKNEDPSGRIRLGTDLRFYEEGAALDERWMRGVWAPDDGL